MGKTQRVVMMLGMFGIVTAGSIWEIGSATSQDKTSPPKAESKKKAPEEPKNIELANFMRKKLEASAEILEGLTAEDSKLIIKGARALVEMSNAEKWKVRNDVMYRQFSGEFQRSAQSLLEAAEKENFDAAALKWIDTTMKCLECHKFVRGMRLAGGNS